MRKTPENNLPRWLRITIELLLLFAALLGFFASGGMFIVHGEPRVKVNCVATNYPVILAHKNADGTASEEEVDDWRVNCTITDGEKKIFDEPLTLPHPTTFRDAMDAIDQFRKVRAAKILKEKK